MKARPRAAPAENPPTQTEQIFAEADYDYVDALNSGFPLTFTPRFARALTLDSDDDDDDDEQRARMMLLLLRDCLTPTTHFFTKTH